MKSAPVSMLSGAASGIGRHMAGRLLADGHRVLALDIDSEGLARLAADHRSAAARLVVSTLDVRDAAAWSAAVELAVRTYGEIDFMFNIAGYLQPGHVHEVDAELLARHLDVNAKGAMFATQAGARQMVKQGFGHILNLASIAGLSHVPGLAAYAASKHAVRGFSLSVAHELRPHNVFVSVLCPDAVETPMLKLQEEYAEARMTFAARRALTVQEVERALLRLMRTRELELVLDVPLTFRGAAARLANAFPRLTQLAQGTLQRQGARVQKARLSGS